MKLSGPLLLAGCLTAAPALAGGPTFASGEGQVHVIELYTSEGCSSCPPADHWLRQWTARDELWNQLIPLALHVDYWDYLGWRDPFASPDHSVRQRRYRRERGLSAVYTPGFLFDGREWRRWSGGRLPDLEPAREVGQLVLRLDGDWATAHFKPLVELGRARVHVAVLGFGLRSEVPAGENRGRTLRHDFVVLGMSDQAMTASDDGLTARLPVPAPRRPAPRLGIAAWISDGYSQAPVQAVGGWLTD